jgi:hypothetical protein
MENLKNTYSSYYREVNITIFIDGRRAAINRNALPPQKGWEGRDFTIDLNQPYHTRSNRRLGALVSDTNLSGPPWDDNQNHRNNS